jgi:uncharacterized RDD family membrane protein YckC
MQQAPAAPAHPLDTAAEIETPEQVRFRYQVAGPALRVTAYVLDLLIRFIVVLVLTIPMQVTGTMFDADYTTGATLLVVFAVEWGYYVLFESLWSGRTPGKKAMRLRVVREGGHPTGFLDIVLRNLLRAADFLPAFYSLGLWVMGLDHRFRRLGDMVAGTMVIVEDSGRLSNAIAVNPPPSADELAALPARPDLRPHELEALDLFLRRLGTLSGAREVELAEMIAPTLARRLGNLRYKDPVRFLALVYLRAIGAAVPAARR